MERIISRSGKRMLFRFSYSEVRKIKKKKITDIAVFLFLIKCQGRTDLKSHLLEAFEAIIKKIQLSISFLAISGQIQNKAIKGIVKINVN